MKNLNRTKQNRIEPNRNIRFGSIPKFNCIQFIFLRTDRFRFGLVQVPNQTKPTIAHPQSRDSRPILPMAYSKRRIVVEPPCKSCSSIVFKLGCCRLCRGYNSNDIGVSKLFLRKMS